MSKERAMELLSKAIEMLVDEEVMYIDIIDELGLTTDESELILGGN